MPSIFISYRRDDSAFESTVLYDTLQKSFGKRNVFMDVDGIPIGVDFSTHIVKTLRRSDICLAVISESWVAAETAAGQRRLDDPQDFVRQELEISQASGLHVVPVLIGKTEVPSKESLPNSLQFLPALQVVRIRPGGDLQQDLKLLCERLRQIGELRAAAIPDNRPRHVLGRLGKQMSRCVWHPFLDALAFGSMFALLDLVYGSSLFWRPLFKEFAGHPWALRVFAFLLVVALMYGFAVTILGASVLYWAIHEILYCGAMSLCKRFMPWRRSTTILFITSCLLTSLALLLGHPIVAVMAVYWIIWMGLLLGQHYLDRDRARLERESYPLRDVLKQKAISGAIASLWFLSWLGPFTLLRGDLGEMNVAGIFQGISSTLFLLGCVGSIYCTAAYIVRGTLRWRTP
jgi:hypothetical protein